MLSGAMMKYPEFDYWGLSFVKYGGADARLNIDHQPGWFYYTYSLTHEATGVVLDQARFLHGMAMWRAIRLQVK